jgi:hypothetical protein
MMRKTVAFVVVICSLWASPTFAQTGVGGPRRSQNYVGGPTAQKNPVVPPLRDEMAKTGQSVSKVRKR